MAETRRKTGKNHAVQLPDGADMERAFVVSSLNIAMPEKVFRDFEYALNSMTMTFQRWMRHGMIQAGHPELSALEILVLRSVNQNGPDESIASVMAHLQLSERHPLDYALKKLDRLGLITRRRQRKEVFVGLTDKGRKACRDHARLQHQCLLAAMPQDRKIANMALTELTGMIRQLAAIYDHAIAVSDAT
ncbi:winged helix DNA-binding protein [Acetobacter sp. TBRC 12305]|uniref:Winged helix DNA-binding protein n=1 Tax=Acetobacter garciniae TaxID=2817435 RepID=A0A939HQ74_9PROT|nr:winged helix DNA-binding protein [Acetobacter garciniae]MBO1325489.1 winged helix DNA-binding protein [Acetobacter garciniae]MBX0345339.1 winged helix DNA-binding protein [Acetobacter garciniae]